MKEKYSSTHQYYEITVSDNGKGTATSLVFEKREGVTINDKADIYFLRTSLNGKEEQTLWTIYNLIREIEYTFYGKIKIMQSGIEQYARNQFIRPFTLQYRFA